MPQDGNDFLETLTCAKFEELNMDLFCKTMKPIEKVLKDTNVKKEDINEVCANEVSPAFPSSPLFIMLFLLVVQHISPRFNNKCSKTILAKNPPRVSTMMKLLPTMELLCGEVVFFLEKKEQRMSFSSMSVHLHW